MRDSTKNLAGKLLIIGLLLTAAFLFFFTDVHQRIAVAARGANENKVGNIKPAVLKSEKLADKKADKKVEPVSIVTKDFPDEVEDKVVISIVNFGRKNPFEPYRGKHGIKIQSEKKKGQLNDVPEPPAYTGETPKDVETLMASTINGILYDPYEESTAIVNIGGTDYMLHEGDSVQGMRVKKITEKAVTLQYGANTYTAGVGDIVDGEIKGDSVQRNGRAFAGSGRGSNLINTSYSDNSHTNKDLDTMKDYQLPDINPEE
jgi:hypothetical protein